MLMMIKFFVVGVSVSVLVGLYLCCNFCCK